MLSVRQPSSSIAAVTYDDLPIGKRPEDTLWHVFVRDRLFYTKAVATDMPRRKYVQDTANSGAFCLALVCQKFDLCVCPTTI